MNKKINNYSSSFSLKLYNLCQRIPLLRRFKVILYFIDGILLLFLKKPKYKKNKKKKVLIIYNYAFGDGIIFMSVFKNIRKIYPKTKYEVNLICQKGLNPIYENYNIFDYVISYDLTKSTFNLYIRRKLFKILRKEYYDILLDPIGCYECTTNVFMSRVISAKEKITSLDITLDNRMTPLWMIKKIYTRVIRIDISNLSLIEYYNYFFNGLYNTSYEIELSNFDTSKVSLKIPNDYFIVFPSASTSMKKWPLDNYAQLIKDIYNKTKLKVMFCGTGSDVNDVDYILTLLDKTPSYNFINKTSLIEFIYLIQNARFVITNDTSTYHIAVTNQIPVTLISGGYTYDRYAKYNFKNDNKYKKPYLVIKKKKCFNCDNKCKYLKKSDKIWPCLKEIDYNYAKEIVNKMIDENYNKDGKNEYRKIKKY